MLIFKSVSVAGSPIRRRWRALFVSLADIVDAARVAEMSAVEEMRG